MSIDAVIEKVERVGDDLVLSLAERAAYQPKGRDNLTIKNFTIIPEIGLDIWGGSNSCIIENPDTVEGRLSYRRVLGDLFENF